MRSFFIITFLLVMAGVTYGQNIVQAEYFIDQDLGVGNNTPITITDGAIIDENFTALTSVLPSGTYTLHVRTRDDSGVWGFTEAREFIIKAVEDVTTPPVYDIVKLEYFIDQDPGPGLGTDIPVSQSSEVDPPNISFITSGLSEGYHTVGVRAQNSNGDWGVYELRQVYVTPSSTVTPPVLFNIVKMEYFVNQDPGVGMGIDIPITPNLDVEVPRIDFMTNGLPVGYHTVGVRAQNSNGDWGLYELRQVYITPSSSITPPTVYDVSEIEYFFDNDPGVGLATKWPSVIQNNEIDLNEILTEANVLTPGQHTIVVRGKNANGEWGFYERRQILIKTDFVNNPTVPNIVKMEYFFDGQDPGIGNAIELPITPSTDIDLNTVDVATPQDLIDGQHKFSIRALDDNGMWSMVETDTFRVLDDCTQPVAAFTPQLGCAKQLVTFVDNSTSLQPDAQYRWYLDGDNVVDATTVGNATFTYDLPGDYVVALAIRQGTICLDSMATTITIKDLPAVAISATGSTTNQPIAFEASTVNLDPSATWSWDFDSNGTPESTNPNTASHTYASDGSYTTTLTVSDGLGCEVTATKALTVSSGGGTVTPSTNFIVGDGCVGQSIQFTDLSQNLPAGSTYSWDFDGDGSEDSNVQGLVQYVFATAGTYTANLTIDLGSSTIQASKIINIVEVPIANFDGAKTCVGTPTTFTDLSTSVTAGAVYMWDFDNDGSVDSNVSGDASFSYPAPGNYIARLTINNGSGCQHSIVKQVQVVDQPASNFITSISCTNEAVLFTDLSTKVNSDAVYSWDFNGDGIEDNSLIGDPSYTYGAKGIYDATLTITNDPGCSQTYSLQVDVRDRPNADIDIIAKCYGQESLMLDLSTNVEATATYSWDLGDGTSISNATPGGTSHIYEVYNSYVVNLTVDNGGGCNASVEELVVFSDAAVPDFTFGKSCVGEEVIFTDASTETALGATYFWDFNGDGITDSERPDFASYAYGQEGIYMASLSIDNGDQCIATKTLAVDVTGPPTIDLGPDVFLCNDSTVVLDAGEGYSSYSWLDGPNLGPATQTFTVDLVGEYIATVVDAKQCVNSDTIVVDYLGDPVPAFSYTYQLSLDGVYVNFINNSDLGASYEWNFGDGTPPVFEESPIHLYTEYYFYQNTLYEVCLTATNDCDRPAQICQFISLSPTELSADDVSMQVYPNPASDYLTIQFDDVPLRAQLLDPNGKSVWRRDSPNRTTELRVSDWSSGIYILTLMEEDGIYYRNVVIQ